MTCGRSQQLYRFRTTCRGVYIYFYVRALQISHFILFRLFIYSLIFLNILYTRALIHSHIHLSAHTLAARRQI